MREDARDTRSELEREHDVMEDGRDGDLIRVLQYRPVYEDGPVVVPAADEAQLATAYEILTAELKSGDLGDQWVVSFGMMTEAELNDLGEHGGW